MNSISSCTSLATMVSDSTVVGPTRPTFSVTTGDWHNTDSPSAAQPPRNVQMAVRMPDQPARPAPQKLPTVAESPKKPGWRYKLTMAAGMGIGIIGTIGGFVSIVGLGPIGLAIAGGCAIVGTILIRSACKMASK